MSQVNQVVLPVGQGVIVSKRAYSLLLETIYMVPNVLQGHNSKTKLSNSNFVIFIQFSILARLAPRNRYPMCTNMRRDQNKYLVCPFRFVLANVFLFQVGASPLKIH